MCHQCFVYYTTFVAVTGSHLALACEFFISIIRIFFLDPANICPDLCKSFWFYLDYNPLNYSVTSDFAIYIYFLIQIIKVKKCVVRKP